ncbi:MAG: hypothetical protein ACK559_03305 [bacterium]
MIQSLKVGSGSRERSAGGGAPGSFGFRALRCRGLRGGFALSQAVVDRIQHQYAGAHHEDADQGEGSEGCVAPPGRIHHARLGMTAIGADQHPFAAAKLGNHATAAPGAGQSEQGL